MWQRDRFFSGFHVGRRRDFYFGMNQNFLQTPASGVSNYLTARAHYKAAPGSGLVSLPKLGPQ